MLACGKCPLIDILLFPFLSCPQAGRGRKASNSPTADHDYGRESEAVLLPPLVFTQRTLSGKRACRLSLPERKQSTGRGSVPLHLRFPLPERRKKGSNYAFSAGYAVGTSRPDGPPNIPREPSSRFLVFFHFCFSWTTGARMLKSQRILEETENFQKRLSRRTVKNWERTMRSTCVRIRCCRMTGAGGAGGTVRCPSRREVGVPPT
jgi:hypothetical protein